MLYVPSTQQVEAKWLSPAWRMRILDTHTYPSDHMTPHSDDILSKSFLALEAHISPVRLKFSGAARRSTYHNSFNPSPHISPYDFLCLSLARRDISCARCLFSSCLPTADDMLLSTLLSHQPFPLHPACHHQQPPCKFIAGHILALSSHNP